MCLCWWSPDIFLSFMSASSAGLWVSDLSHLPPSLQHRSRSVSGRLNRYRRSHAAKLFFNGMKDSHGVFQSHFCPADCKPKSNKYPKQGREFTAPVVTAARLNKQQMLEWLHREKKREFFVRYSFITAPNLLQPCRSGPHIHFDQQVTRLKLKTIWI